MAACQGILPEKQVRCLIGQPELQARKRNNQSQNWGAGSVRLLRIKGQNEDCNADKELKLVKSKMIREMEGGEGHHLTEKFLTRISGVEQLQVVIKANV